MERRHNGVSVVINLIAIRDRAGVWESGAAGTSQVRNLVPSRAPRRQMPLIFDPNNKKPQAVRHGLGLRFEGSSVCGRASDGGPGGPWRCLGFAFRRRPPRRAEAARAPAWHSAAVPPGCLHPPDPVRRPERRVARERVWHSAAVPRGCLLLPDLLLRPGRRAALIRFRLHTAPARAVRHRRPPGCGSRHPQHLASGREPELEDGPEAAG